MKSIPVEKYRITLDDAYRDIAPDIRAMLSRSDLRHFVNGWNTFVNTKLSQAIQAARIEAVKETAEEVKKIQAENKAANPADELERVDEQAYDAACRDILSIINKHQ